MSEQWVLKSTVDGEFYNGKSYISHGGRFARVTANVHFAKPYSTYAIAVAASKKMNFDNHAFEAERLSKYTIVRVDE